MKSKIIILSHNTYMGNKITRLKFIKEGAKWLGLAATGGIIAELASCGGGGDSGGGGTGPVTPPCGSAEYDCDGYPKVQKEIPDKAFGVSIPKLNLSKFNPSISTNISGTLDVIIRPGIGQQASAISKAFGNETRFPNSAEYKTCEAMRGIASAVGSQDATQILHISEGPRDYLIDSMADKMEDKTKFYDLIDAFMKGTYLAQASDAETKFNKNMAKNEMDGIYTELGIPTKDHEKSLATVITQLVTMFENSKIGEDFAIILHAIKSNVQLQRWTKDVIDLGMEPTYGDKRIYDVPGLFDFEEEKTWELAQQEEQRKSRFTIAMQKPNKQKIV